MFLAAACAAEAGGGTFEKVEKLIPALGAGKWKQREKAQDDIFLAFAADSEPAVAAVAVALARERDPEIKLRLEKILHRMAPEHVRTGERGFLGVSLGKTGGPVKVGNEFYGPVDIVGVLAGSAAAAAGISAGERILLIDDVKCTASTTVEDAVKYISSRGPGAKVKFVNLTVDKKVKARTIVLGDRPPQPNDPPEEVVKEFMMSEWLKSVQRRAALMLEEGPKD